MLMQNNVEEDENQERLFIMFRTSVLHTYILCLCSEVMPLCRPSLMTYQRNSLFRSNVEKMLLKQIKKRSNYSK